MSINTYWLIALAQVFASIDAVVEPELPPEAPTMILLDGTIVGGKSPSELATRFKREVVDAVGARNLKGSPEGKMVAIRGADGTWSLIADWREPGVRTEIPVVRSLRFLDCEYVYLWTQDGGYIYDAESTNLVDLPHTYITIATIKRKSLIGIQQDEWSAGRAAFHILDITENIPKERVIQYENMGRIFTRLAIVPGGRYFLFSSESNQTWCSDLDGKITDSIEGVLDPDSEVGVGQFALSTGEILEVPGEGEIAVTGNLHFGPMSISPDKHWLMGLGPREGWGVDSESPVYLIDAMDRKRKWKLGNWVVLWLVE